MLLGASGIGKSTLLRLIAGLEQPSAGKILLSSETRIAWLAQHDALFPWLSVIENVQLADYLNGSLNAQSQQKAMQLLEAVGMSAHKGKACYQLLGGQRQRVALARTLMQDADLVLMDEPFSALDAVTRLQLQQLAHQLLADKTVLLITHDPQEAIRLADHIFLLRQQPIQLLPVFQPEGDKPRFQQNQAWRQLEQQLLATLTHSAGGDENA